MGFPSDLLRLEAEVQLFRQCAALVKALMKRRRVLFITMFMFVCLQPGLIQSCPRDEERKRRRLLRLLLQGKGDGGVRPIRRRESRGAPLLRFVLLLVLLHLHISYPPSYSPSICPSLSARMDACVVVCPMFAIPDELIVVSLRSVRSTERLQHRALLSVHDGGHVHQGFLLFLVEEVDCCVPCSSITTRPIFSCGHPRKNHGRPRRSSNRTNGGDDRRGGHVASAAARRKGVLRLSAPRDSMTCRER